MTHPSVTSHGYAINEDVRKLLENPPEVPDCGGPGRCTRCTAEATDYFAVYQPTVRATDNETQLYPRRRPDSIIFDDESKKTSRRWHVVYHLVYDNGGSKWRGYYRFRITARIAAAYNYFLRSYGGTATLIDTRKLSDG